MIIIVIITIIILFIIRNYKNIDKMTNRKPIYNTYYVQPILIKPVTKDTQNLNLPCSEWQKCPDNCSLVYPNKVYPGNMFTGLNSLKTLFPCGKCKCLFDINNTS